VNGRRSDSLRRLLILSCSQRKRTSSDLLPALDRYDGPAFRVLRKYLRERPADARSLDVLILSAEHGLIPSHRPIAYYDRRISAERAAELCPQVRAELERALSNASYADLFIGGGKLYSAALKGDELPEPAGASAIRPAGPPGCQLTQLRDWLHGRHLRPSGTATAGRRLLPPAVEVEGS